MCRYLSRGIRRDSRRDDSRQTGVGVDDGAHRLLRVGLIPDERGDGVVQTEHVDFLDAIINSSL